MQTVPEFACYIEHDDFILYRGAVYQVKDIDDTDDLIVFDVTDEHDEKMDLPALGPFEPVERITSFEDDEDISIEDI